jgi:hypothetical protein
MRAQPGDIALVQRMAETRLYIVLNDQQLLHSQAQSFDLLPMPLLTRVSLRTVMIDLIADDKMSHLHIHNP